MLDRPDSTRLHIDDDDDDDDDDHKSRGPSALIGRHLLKRRVVMVTKPVDRELMSQVVAQLLVLDAEDPQAPITMYINCPGGDADSGFGIYDAMRFVRAPVTTVCLGLAASAAIIIFLGGEKGRRFSLPNSRFLIHQPSSQVQGQASDLEITAKEIMRTRDKYNKIIAAETGRPEKQLVKDANRDFWLGADEAVEYGLVSAIIESYASLNSSG